MKLYGIKASNNVRRAHAVALHLCIPVDVVEVLPGSPAAKTREFKLISPAGRVPALQDGDFGIDESHAIMLYLAETKPSSLWPADRIARTQIVRWMSWSIAHWTAAWDPLQYERVIKQVYFGGRCDEAKVQIALRSFHAEAQPLEAHLTGRTWLVNENLTLADFSVAAGLCYADLARFPLDPYPAIRAWMGRIEELPAWRNSAPLPPLQLDRQ